MGRAAGRREKLRSPHHRYHSQKEPAKERGTMKGKLIKVITVFLALIPFALWLNKVNSYVEVEQKNDRIAISNEVVRIINNAQESIQGSQSLFELFTRLDQLDASQQRGAWGLLDLADITVEQDIAAAKAELEVVFSDAKPEDQALLAPALQLLDTYHGYHPVYEEIVQVIRSKNLSTTEFQAFLSGQYQRLALLNGESLDHLKTVQYNYIRGE
jgi:hypothetical protein